MSKQTDLINIPDAITVSGSNVGIGTSSPSAKLDIQQATAGNIISAEFDNTDYTANNRNAIKIRQQVSSSGSLSTFLGNDRNTGNVFLSNDSITANHLVIDTSGNVGIGDTSPYTWSSVQPSLNLRGTSSSFPNRSGALIFKSQSGTHMTVMDFETGNDLRWYQSSNSGSSWSERMRIDSSGNLLVGKTGNNNSAVGVSIRPNEVSAVRDGGNPLLLNRLTSDGEIALFCKDSTIVGSIGTQGSRLSIGSGDVNLNFNASANSMYPISNPTSGALSDGIINVGAATARFKDAYLSGGVYLGGTGSANKLSDYEIGTWTPTVTAASGSINAFGTFHGIYTKIGREVSLHFQFSVTDIGSASGNLIVSNLPFGKETSVLTYYLGIHRARSSTSSISELTSSGTLQLYGTTPINSTYLGSIVYTTNS